MATVLEVHELCSDASSSAFSTALPTLPALPNPTHMQAACIDIQDDEHSAPSKISTLLPHPNSMLPHSSSLGGHRNGRETSSLSIFLLLTVIALLPISSLALFQTDFLPSVLKLAIPVMCRLLVTIVGSLLFLFLLFTPEPFGKGAQVEWGIHTCFCLLIFAMVVGVALLATDDLAPSSFSEAKAAL